MSFIRKQSGFSLLLFILAVYLPYSNAQSSNKINIKPALGNINSHIQQVLLIHPRFIAAQAEFDAATSRYKAATNAIYNPELELDEQKTTVRTSTVGLSQTIDWGDQQGANTQIAKHQLDAARARFQQERQSLMRDLLMVSVDYKNKTRLAELSNQRLNLMKNFYTVAKQKRLAGDLSQVELDLAQLAYSESIFNNAKILAEHVDAEQTFYAMYGINDISKKSPPEMVDEFQEVSLPSDLNQFLMSLPQIQQTRAMVAANKNIIALRQAESSADPSIAIRGGKEDKETVVGITLTIPLNIRNGFNAEVEAAKKDYLQSEQLAQQAWRNLRRDIISQTRRYQFTRNAWQQWRGNGLTSILRQLNLLKQLWRAGDLSTTDYLVQIKQNLDTQSAAIELQSTLWSSWLTWLDSTAQIESWLQLKDIRK